MAGMDLLDSRLGFGFSAGLFDYVLNYKQATRPLLLLPFGLAYFGLYYGLFRFFIVKLDLKTPGRDAEEVVAQDSGGSQTAPGWIRALGGARNLVSIDACTTRLRLVVANQGAVDEAALKALGARGVVRPSAETLQVVVGPIADTLASEIRAGLKGQQAAAKPLAFGAGAPVQGSPPVSNIPADALLSALGGARNIREVRVAASRLCVTLQDAAAASAAGLESLAIRAIARPSPHSVHLVVGAGATALFDELNELRLGKGA
jgi:N-acetylglucosamine PTS system EIICBA or EIICB component